MSDELNRAGNIISIILAIIIVIVLNIVLWDNQPKVIKKRVDKLEKRVEKLENAPKERR